MTKATRKNEVYACHTPTKAYIEDGITGRKCADCGKRTFNHRCPACLEKWRAKHNVNVNAANASLDA